MTRGSFDRKTALQLAVGVAAILVLKYVVLADRQTTVVAAAENVPAAEARLRRVRELVATLPVREQQYKQAMADLESREKGILKADTAAQAEALIQERLHHVGLANGIDIRGLEDQKVKPLGNDYGQASVSVRFNCNIEQLVNFLAALANEPELFSTDEINVTGTADPKKVIQVRLTLSGVVARKLAQEKKQGGAL
ncbi:MAG TPA: type II secretion system protein GspM [Candidatus Acidoferrales bacterium]|nr:type II secretion system protein GspM [Bryobacteraceae bacterium]HTS67306.1 type II secretion system protein GspM [Candidatus Acidoferrales bacterium]